MSEFLVARESGTQRSLLRQYGAGGKLEHYRHFREDINPHIERVERLSKLQIDTKSEYRYIGSVPRIMINDWLIKQKKTWHDYVTDKDLKAKFLAWFRNDYQKLMANHYQKRRLESRLMGKTILKDYRKENSS